MNSRPRPDLAQLKNSSAWPPAIFLDDGGVLNDNTLRGAEWQRLIAEFMPARMGGTAEHWANANRAVFPQVWAGIVEQLPDFANHQQFQRTYVTSWMTRMCARIGIEAPRDDDAVALYRELSIYIAERATSAFPGAADAVLALHRAGYTLYTASGTTSWELQGITTKMRITEAFSELYGPDLINQVKHGPAFYRRLFAHAGTPPESALVIDSDEECCRWASEAGATALWIDPAARGDATTLDELVHKLI